MMEKHAPWGWNSYDYYDTTVTEEEVRENAAVLAKHLKPYGWEYVVVDIQWYAKDAGSRREEYQYIPFGEVEMDDYGRLWPDPTRFPSSKDGAGFGPLAEYIHGLGLKFGIHIMRGIPREAAHGKLPILGSGQRANEVADPSSICKWNPDMYGLRPGMEGSQAYYDSIFALYASWGVDFVKCDDICNTNLYVDNPYSAAHEIEMIHRAIEKSGRPMVLSLSPGPALPEKAEHYKAHANLWRITDDFWDEWPLLKNMFERCDCWQDHVVEDHYPDCDMLCLGVIGKGFGQERRTRFTEAEQRTLMSLWCMFHSPLMMGGCLTLMDDWTRSLLTNEKILAMESLAYQARQVERRDTYAIWESIHQTEGKRYLAFFNLSEEEQRIFVAKEQNKIVFFLGQGEENLARVEETLNRVEKNPARVEEDSVRMAGQGIFVTELSIYSTFPLKEDR